MNPLDIYKPPFKSDGVYIWSSNEVMALMSLSDADNFDEITDRLADILNGKITPKKKSDFTYQAPEILLNGKPYYVVRGWGHLTGVGALNLDHDKASEIQDAFAEFVIKKLTGQ